MFQESIPQSSPAGRFLAAPVCRLLPALAGLPALTAALLVATALPARADTEIGPYVGLGAGLGAMHFDSIGLRETGDPDQSTGGGKLKLGYRLTPHWGVELGYARLGSVNHAYTSGSFKGHADAVYMAAVGRIALDDHWSAFVKPMLSHSRVRRDSGSAASPEFAALEGSHGNLLLGGLGLDYRWSEQLSVAIEADAYGKAGSRDTAGLLSADLSWHF